MKALLAAAATLAVVCGAQEPAVVAPRTDAETEAVRKSIERGVAFLLKEQNRDGSWGGPRNHRFTDGFANVHTHHTWSVATTGLACMALLECAPPEVARPALERAITFLATNAKVQRPANWDIDNVWSYVFGLNGVSRMLASGRFSDASQKGRLDATAAEYVDGLGRYQSPKGGWAYYADPNAAWRPEWATSFTTASAVIALGEAEEAGVRVPRPLRDAAVRAVRQCRLPTGAYTYSVAAIPTPGNLTWIDQVQGSLGRIQVCDLALHRAGGGLPLADRQRALARLEEHHKFLDIALHKPIPHEAYYYNSAYFYLWAHYYGALLLETLPAEDQRHYWPMIRREVMKTQEPDGGMWDFYMSGHTKPYGTSFGIMSLQRSLKSAP